MKKATLLILNLISFSPLINAQQITKDSTVCKCSYNIQVNSPNVGEKNELHGRVIVEFEIDSLCVASNPKIIQSLGSEYDKEVLRVTNLSIALWNKCSLKCKYANCTKRKISMPFNFSSGDDED